MSALSKGLDPFSISSLSVKPSSSVSGLFGLVRALSDHAVRQVAIGTSLMRKEKEVIVKSPFRSWLKRTQNRGNLRHVASKSGAKGEVNFVLGRDDE